MFSSFVVYKEISRGNTYGYTEILKLFCLLYFSLCVYVYMYVYMYINVGYMLICSL